MAADRVRFTHEGRAAFDTLLQSLREVGQEITPAWLVKVCILHALSVYGRLDDETLQAPRRMDQNAPQRDSPLRRWGPFQADLLVYLLRQLHRQSLSREEVFRRLEVYLDRGIPLVAEQWEEAGHQWSRFQTALHRGLAPQPLPGAPEVVQVGAVRPIQLSPGFANGARQTLPWNHRDVGNLNAAFVGASGMGKTQLALAMLVQALDSADAGFRAVVLDYKGDIAGDAALVRRTGAEVWDPTAAPLHINPLRLERPDAQAIRSLAERITDLLSALQPQIGPVQRNLYRTAITQAFAARSEAAQPWPDLALVHTQLLILYHDEGRARDALVETSDQLGTRGWFASADSSAGGATEARLTIVDLSRLESRRDVVACLVLESLRRQMRLLPDAPVRDGLRYVRTLLLIDEAHHYLRGRSGLVDELLREGRSKGYGVWLATQGPADLTSGELDLTLNLGSVFLFRVPIEPREVRRLLRGVASHDVAVVASDIPQLAPGRCMWTPPNASAPLELQAAHFHGA
jgi:hypothetical protein